MSQSNLLKIVFYVGWFFLCLSFYFKHTMAFHWSGLILLSLLSFYFLFKQKFLHSKKDLPLLIFLLTPLGILFVFVLVNPHKKASFEAFLLNYFFHTAVFLLFMYLAFRENTYLNFIFGTSWAQLQLPLLFTILFILFIFVI